MSPRAEALEALDQALAVYRAALADADAAAAFVSGLGGFDAARAWRAASDAADAAMVAALAVMNTAEAVVNVFGEDADTAARNSRRCAVLASQAAARATEGAE